MNLLNSEEKKVEYDRLLKLSIRNLDRFYRTAIYNHRSLMRGHSINYYSVDCSKRSIIFYHKVGDDEMRKIPYVFSLDDVSTLLFRESFENHGKEFLRHLFDELDLGHLLEG